LKPLTTSTACSVNTFAKLWPMLVSTLSFWEWAVTSTALIVKEKKEKKNYASSKKAPHIN